MRILKKLLVRIILLIVAAGILCGSVVAVLGYLMYRDALKEQNLEDKVAEVQADPSYTALADCRRSILMRSWQWRTTALNSIAVSTSSPSPELPGTTSSPGACGKAAAPSPSSLPRTCILPRSGVLSVRLRRFSWPFGWSRPTQRTRSWSCMSTPFTLATAITVSGTQRGLLWKGACGHDGSTKPRCWPESPMRHLSTR